jgi:lysophospholipase L1-like esterase
MPSWFDDEVTALERRTRDRRGRDDVVLFYGSSSFTLWADMAAHFPDAAVVNHGFGGSTLGDCLEYFDRLVVPMTPRAVVLYAGDNDLDQGASPEAVRDGVDYFIRRKRQAIGAVPMAYVSIKISPARFPIMHKIAYTNRIIERTLLPKGDVRFVDTTRRMIGRGIGPLLACFGDDPLHMNAKGYGIWAQTLRDFLAGLNGR